jgi:hypothetical protein
VLFQGPNFEPIEPREDEEITLDPGTYYEKGTGSWRRVAGAGLGSMVLAAADQNRIYFQIGLLYIADYLSAQRTRAFKGGYCTTK